MQGQDEVSKAIYISPGRRSRIQLQAFLLSGGTGEATQTQKASRLESQSRKFQPTDTFGCNYETRYLGGYQQGQAARETATQVDCCKKTERFLSLAILEIAPTETSLWSRAKWQQRHNQAGRLDDWKKRGK